MDVLAGKEAIDGVKSLQRHQSAAKLSAVVEECL